MALWTLISRVSDGMYLAATQDDAPFSQQQKDVQVQAKKILQTLRFNSPARCTIDAGPFLFHYVIEAGVCFICSTDKAYPKKLAFQYLDELQTEFSKAHADEVSRFSRPYAAVSFDPKLNRIRKQYLNPRSPKNIKKLNEDLTEITYIMRKNISEVLQRGENLKNVQNMSDNLLSESKKFETSSKYLNWLYFKKTYGPIIIVALVVLLVIYLRFFR